MGVYLPYIDMPKDRLECPFNAGGFCRIPPTFNNNVEGSKICVGIDCGRIRPLPNKINGIRVTEIKKHKSNFDFEEEFEEI